MYYLVKAHQQSLSKGSWWKKSTVDFKFAICSCLLLRCLLNRYKAFLSIWPAKFKEFTVFISLFGCFLNHVSCVVIDYGLPVLLAVTILKYSALWDFSIRYLTWTLSILLIGPAHNSLSVLFLWLASHVTAFWVNLFLWQALKEESIVNLWWVAFYIVSEYHFAC